jgi:hypothetical protein
MPYKALIMYKMHYKSWKRRILADIELEIAKLLSKAQTKERRILMKNAIFSGVGLVALLCSAAWSLAPASAQDAVLSLLTNLERGQWEVRFRGSGETTQICLRTGYELIQLRHKQANCNRFVVEDGAQQLTVQYTCPGNGYGRTNVRRETSSLVQVESQGIEGGAPFQFTGEARRVGSC